MGVDQRRLYPWALALVLFGCAEPVATGPACDEAQRLFDAIYPTTAATLGFKGVPAHAAPMELASGVAATSVRRLPDPATRAACYGQIMRSHGHRFFISLRQVEAARGN